MSKYRIDTILAQESNLTPGTKTIDLGQTDPFSRIQIIEKITGAGTAQTHHVADGISKVEIVDGSDVLWSLTGKEIQALDMYNTGVMPYNALVSLSGVQSIATFNLNFGRFLMDPVLALDLSKAKNPQLKITHSCTTIDASATASTIEVYGWMFDSKRPTPSGFLSAKEHYSYTPGSSGTIEEIQLPRDYITRKYLVCGYAAGYMPWETANNVRIDENNNKSVWFDMKMSAWLKTIYSLLGTCDEFFEINSTSSTGALYCAASFDMIPSPVVSTAAYFACSAFPPKTPITLETNSASLTVCGYVRGYCPHHAIPIFLGNQQDVDDWYDPSALDAVRMRITAGSGGSSGTMQVVTEQLRKY